MTSSGNTRFLSIPIFGCSPRPRNNPGGSILKLPIRSLCPSITQNPYSFIISSFCSLIFYNHIIKIPDNVTRHIKVAETVTLLHSCTNNYNTRSIISHQHNCKIHFHITVPPTGIFSKVVTSLKIISQPLYIPGMTEAENSKYNVFGTQSSTNLFPVMTPLKCHHALTMRMVVVAVGVREGLS
jgi:hypothetical protein